MLNFMWAFIKALINIKEKGKGLVDLLIFSSKSTSSNIFLNSQGPESVSFEWEVREWVVFMKPWKRIICKIIHNYRVPIQQNRAKMNAVFQWRGEKKEIDVMLKPALLKWS